MNWMSLLGGGVLGAALPAWGERFDYMLPQNMQAGKPKKALMQPQLGAQQQLPQQQVPIWLQGLGR